MEETFEVVPSSPHWLWGGEMGANEWGVAIGNEAVFAKEPAEEKGLLGMDLIRLALERARTAKEAMEVIIELIGRHGQGGQCFEHLPLSYHNSFIIADPKESWILETVGRRYVAKRVTDGVYSISNGYTIGRDWDLASEDIVEYAIKKGWCSSEEEFDFAVAYSDPSLRQVTKCEARRQRSMQLLQEASGSITPERMMSFLRDHGLEAEGSLDWSPAEDLAPKLCKHSNHQSVDQATASYVGHLTSDKPPVHWFTEGGSPCLAPFKPVFLGGAGIADDQAEDLSRFNPQSRWWVQERLHRAVLLDYPKRASFVRTQIQTFEQECLAQVKQLLTENMDKGTAAERFRSFSETCFDQALERVRQWTREVLRMPISKALPKLYSDHWETLTREAGIDLQGEFQRVPLHIRRSKSG